MIVPSHADKMQWARFAQMQYGARNNDVGHRYSAYASLPSNAAIDEGIYFTLNQNMQQGPK